MTSAPISVISRVSVGPDSTLLRSSTFSPSKMACTCVPPPPKTFAVTLTRGRSAARRDEPGSEAQPHNRHQGAGAQHDAGRYRMCVIRHMVAGHNPRGARETIIWPGSRRRPAHVGAAGRGLRRRRQQQ